MQATAAQDQLAIRDEFHRRCFERYSTCAARAWKGGEQCCQERLPRQVVLLPVLAASTHCCASVICFLDAHSPYRRPCYVAVQPASSTTESTRLQPSSPASLDRSSLRPSSSPSFCIAFGSNYDFIEHQHARGRSLINTLYTAHCVRDPSC